MASKDCIAMILAGGSGSRLGTLTRKIAKPAVPYGAKYRIIDFTLSNCIHSGIDTVGVLTQYQPLELNTYIGNGQPWDLDRNNGGVYVLPPYVDSEKSVWYKGTANAIYQNIDFVDQFKPNYVVIAGGDHIYKMDYAKMLREGKDNGAAAMIAVIDVSYEEAKRFGIMSVDEEGRITKFAEKPKQPESTLASMGVYVFKWSVLKKYLLEDEKNPNSSNDFGKNIIPTMLAAGEKLYCHRFDGYWKDVGTLHSLWEANMDLIEDKPKFDLYDNNWTIFSRNPVKTPHYIAKGAKVVNSCITEGCSIYGTVDHSILSESVTVAKGAVIRDSIIMAGVTIGEGCQINKAIIAHNTNIGANVEIGIEDIGNYKSNICENGLTLIGNDLNIKPDTKIGKNAMVQKSI